MQELPRDQGRPPDIRNMDLILAMSFQCRHEAECTLILGTFVELGNREIVLKRKVLLVNKVVRILKNKLE